MTQKLRRFYLLRKDFDALRSRQRQRGARSTTDAAYPLRALRRIGARRYFFWLSSHLASASAMPVLTGWSAFCFAM